MPTFGFSLEIRAAWAHIDWVRIPQGLHYKTGRSGLTALGLIAAITYDAFINFQQRSGQWVLLPTCRGSLHVTRLSK